MIPWRLLMNELRLPVRVSPQPTETTCGPTCLHGVYRFWGDAIPLDRVIDESGSLPEGGTLSVLLARHALDRGYRATIYSYNVQLFDPTWTALSREALAEKLRRQYETTQDAKLQNASRGYIDFLDRGGTIRFHTLSERLIRTLLEGDHPILTGLSATYLYQTTRERPDTNVPDDIDGKPVGHFVVLAGHRPRTRELLVCDPWQPNPLTEAHRYWLDVDRVVSSILLGIITYDATLLIVEPQV
jgi:hypothetical protein